MADINKKWYVVHTQTGSEEKAKAGLESRMLSTELKKYIQEIVVSIVAPSYKAINATVTPAISSGDQKIAIHICADGCFNLSENNVVTAIVAAG